MAKVYHSTHRKTSTFESVFGSRPLRPPKRHQRFEPQARASFEDAYDLLYKSSRTSLGINDENFEYGPSHLRSEARFKAHYSSSPNVNDIKKPDEHDRLLHQIELDQSKLWSHLQEWQMTLGGDRIRKAFASILDRLITEFVRWAYAGVYDEGVIPHMRFWVEYVFGEYVVHFLNALRSCESNIKLLEEAEVSSAETQRWYDLALTRLGALRTDELFDIVVDWDETESGINDLRQYATKPATRSYLTDNFANALSTRLLHPGASTIDILRIYIRIIRAFRQLDPKGVLLDRVARLIRRYLHGRDDTVRVVVAGLLSDPVQGDGEQPPSSSDTLTELAFELSMRDTREESKGDHELDWDNMGWVPDPVDAAPDYMKSKNIDVIGSLISLFESKDIFVKELQATLADRLLRNKADFDQEISVVEHLKIRFGDTALQGCQVMLRDILDSRKVDSVIRRDLGMDKASTDPDPEDQSVSLHGKILSRLFWPAMQDQAFHVPEAIISQQAKYEKGFEALKQSRKLTWVNFLGQVEVELDLEDRVFHDEVSPWQAAVIHAFRSDDDWSEFSSQAGRAGISHTVSQLADQLGMSATLVRSACIFWVSKRILSESRPDTYTVLETLPDGDTDRQNIDTPSHSHSRAAANNKQTTNIHTSSGTAAAAAEAAQAAEAAAAQAAREAADAERQSQMAVYQQFIISMLTNQGAMPLPRIAMMLSIVVPGGFPFGNEELKDVLGGMVRDGRLEMGHGGVYKVV